MTAELSWFVARTAGLLGWALAALAALWGLVAAARLLDRRPGPARLVDLHRHLGALALVFTVVHVAAVVADDFVAFSVADALVPLAADTDPWGVATGVIALWMLVTVQVSSWSRAHLPRRTWRALHALSAPLLVAAGVHAIALGTDMTNPVVVVTALVLGAELVFLAGLRLRVAGAKSARSERDESEGHEREHEAGRL